MKGAGVEKQLLPVNLTGYLELFAGVSIVKTQRHIFSFFIKILVDHS